MNTVDLPLTSTGDIDVQNGDVELATGEDSFTQRLRVRLKSFVNEWYLDRRMGLPYYELILVKNPSIPLIEGLFRAFIMATPGAAELIYLRSELDARTRAFSLSFKVRTVDGQVVEEEGLVLP